MFTDRKDAALKLAKALEKYKDKNVIVLGIPRGGAETAYYIALHLHAEFSLLISRKLGHPSNPEYALGAIAEDGSVYLSPFANEEFSKETINEIIDLQKKEIERRIKILRKGKPLPDLKDRTVILADDGIATGATIFAAIEMCKKRKAGKIVIAAPVSGYDMEEMLGEKADEVIILEKPGDFFAVSQAYQSFYNLSDDDALGFMERWEKEKGVLKS
ncbi:phosphoribosyltransferase [Ginsengibacter hankyongi]|uniref:Phosphoribosyltransferase n=1 Tax=Ginsengibacter hankyongi TaxID=2607284 RepID=A0A5J5IBD6_9BACT|nr:phosphoribosyltransferase family protein [Ginsengibacter hankyongi]KAA9035665.1 phosphoribosyltransferase [Ginsengibacter hankyongi]